MPRSQNVRAENPPCSPNRRMEALARSAAYFLDRVLRSLLGIIEFCDSDLCILRIALRWARSGMDLGNGACFRSREGGPTSTAMRATYTSGHPNSTNKLARFLRSFVWPLTTGRSQLIIKAALEFAAKLPLRGEDDSYQGTSLAGIIILHYNPASDPCNILGLAISMARRGGLQWRHLSKNRSSRSAFDSSISEDSSSRSRPPGLVP
jgi:hypothetical protein